MAQAPPRSELSEKSDRAIMPELPRSFRYVPDGCDDPCLRLRSSRQKRPFRPCVLGDLQRWHRNSVENDLDAGSSVVVGGNCEINEVRISVGINDAEHGNTETDSFLHGDVFLAYVNYEEGSGKTREIGDRSKVLLELCTLTADLQDLALREIGVGTVGREFVDVGHLLHSLADRGGSW